MALFNHNKKNNGISTITNAEATKTIAIAGDMVRSLTIEAAQAPITPPPTDPEKALVTIWDSNSVKLRGHRPKMTCNFKSAGSRIARNIINGWLPRRIKMSITPACVLTSMARATTVCSGMVMAKISIKGRTRHVLIHTSNVFDGQIILNETELADMGILKHITERPRKILIVQKATALRRATKGLNDSDIRGDEFMKKANNEDGLTQCPNCEFLNQIYFNPKLYKGMTITVKSKIIKSCSEMDSTYNRSNRATDIEEIREEHIRKLAEIAKTDKLYIDAMTVVDHYETKEQLDLLPDDNVIHQYRDIWNEIGIYKGILMYRDKILIPGAIPVCAADIHRESHSDNESDHDDASSSYSTISECSSPRRYSHPIPYSPTMPDYTNSGDDTDEEFSAEENEVTQAMTAAAAERINKNESFMRVQKLPNPFPTHESSEESEITAPARGGAEEVRTATLESRIEEMVIMHDKRFGKPAENKPSNTEEEPAATHDATSQTEDADEEMTVGEVNSCELLPLQSPTVSTSSPNDLKFGDIVYTWTTDPNSYVLEGTVITPTKNCHPDRQYVVHILGNDYERYRHEIRTIDEHIWILRDTTETNETTEPTKAPAPKQTKRKTTRAATPSTRDPRLNGTRPHTAKPRRSSRLSRKRL